MEQLRDFFAVPGTLPMFLTCLLSLFFSGYVIAHTLQYLAYLAREARGKR
jgi:hypothetical protein